MYDICDALSEKMEFLKFSKVCAEHREPIEYMISTRLLCAKCQWKNHPACQKINSREVKNYLENNWRLEIIQGNYRRIVDQCEKFIRNAERVKRNFKIRVRKKMLF